MVKNLLKEMDKLKLNEWRERLKTNGAQMGRILSGKMKEILQTPSLESKLVNEATFETLEEPNWGMNMRICVMINSKEFSETEVVRAIKKKICGKNVVSQRLSLDLLEACTTNCNKVSFEVASAKILEEMVKMINNPQTNHVNKNKALQLIRAWGQSEDLAYLPVFRQTYIVRPSYVFLSIIIFIKFLLILQTYINLMRNFSMSHRGLKFTTL